MRTPYRRSLLFAFIVGLAMATFLWVQREERLWSKALYLGRVVDSDLSVLKLSLLPGVKVGDKLQDLKHPFTTRSVTLVDLTEDAWAHTKGDVIKSLGGTALYSGDKLMLSVGDNAQGLVNLLGYPHRVVTMSNGADFVYFIEGRSDGPVLCAKLVGNSMAKLRIRLFQLGAIPEVGDTL